MQTNILSFQSHLVGRGEEVQEVSRMILRRDERLITFLGEAGVGKTRLAQQIGLEVSAILMGGAWFASLIESSTAVGIAYELGEALAKPLNSAQADPVQAMGQMLRSLGPCLIILDNFEHIAGLADEVINPWLTIAPDVSILVTSRRPLRLVQERVYRLESLAIPRGVNYSTLEDASNVPSVKLFVDRCTQIEPDINFDDNQVGPIIRICQSLEGLPLAIELAAGKIRVMSPVQIFENLDRVSQFRRIIRGPEDRYETIEGAIQWSYDLLRAREKSLLLYMSIFKDGFSRKAILQILHGFDGLDEQEIESILEILVEQSLLRTNRDDGRVYYVLPVQIDRFADRRLLEECDIDVLEELHMRWSTFYVELGEELAAAMHGASYRASLDEIARELENIFGAQEWLIQQGQPELAARAILSVSEFMSIRGPAPLREPKLRASFDALGFQHSTADYSVQLQAQLSDALWAMGKWTESLSMASEAVERAADIECSAIRAKSFLQHAKILSQRGLLRGALRSLDQARTHLREAREVHLLIATELQSGSIHERLGNLPLCLQYLEGAEDLCNQTDDVIQLAKVHNVRGLAYWHHGDLEKGLHEFIAAKDCVRKVNNIPRIGALDTNIGLVSTDLMKFEKAIAHFESAAASHAEFGYTQWASVNFGGWGRALLLRNSDGDLSEALKYIEKAEGLAREIYYPETLALHAGDKGRTLLGLHRYEEAIDYVREAISLERQMGAMKDHRHFCNYVTLARICDKLGRNDELWDSLVKARKIATTLGPQLFSRVFKAASDLRYLDQLEASYMQSVSGLAGDFGYKEVKDLARSPPVALGGIRFAPNIALEYSAKVEACEAAEVFEYPWRDLEEMLRSRGDRLKLFAYGSLLNSRSAAQTLSAVSLETERAAVAFGLVRLLDYDMPKVVRERPRYNVNPASPLARGIFNVRMTGSMAHAVNGLVFDVQEEDIAALREREVGYDLHAITVGPWGHMMTESPELAFVLSATGKVWKGQMLSNRELTPHAQYYSDCRQGAGRFGDAFLEFWDESSWIASGKKIARRFLAESLSPNDS